MTTKIETLIARLDDCQSRIGKMCSEHRGPRMSIPARPDYDDDLVICQTIRDTMEHLRQADQQAQPQVRELTDEEIAEAYWSRHPSGPAMTQGSIQGIRVVIAADRAIQKENKK